MAISCTFANAEHTQVVITDQSGRTFTVPADWPGEFRMGNSVADILALLGKSEPDAYVAPPTPEIPLALTQIACARLLVDGWDVTGVERSTGLSVAFVADTDTVWAFFNDPQPDTYYVVMPADGVIKHEDYLEITRPGLAAINLVVSRVQ